MVFSTKRGRPRTKHLKKDYGTKELREKRLLNITIEPLDLCLKRQLIDESEHKRALHLRWLYTLKFGSPVITAYNPDNEGLSGSKYPHSDWLVKRSKEYDKILRELTKSGVKRIIMNVCIFNQRPSFLMPLPACRKDIIRRNSDLVKFRTGLDVLKELLG